MTALLWIFLAAAAFALALAIQMRIMVALALRRALAAQFGGKPHDPAYRQAIRLAGQELAGNEHVRHLEAIYPRPLEHLGLARRASRLLPLVLVGLVAYGRFSLGAI